jgi:hypothetical protein
MVVRCFEATPEELAEAISPSAVSNRVARWTRLSPGTENPNRVHLVEMSGEFHPGVHQPLGTTELLARIDRLFQTQRLIAFERHLPTGFGIGVKEAPEGVETEPPPPPVEEKTWIEIELLGLDGKPIPHEKYKITLPDGSTRSGDLDGDGAAREGDVDPGMCQVTFPDLFKRGRPKS